MKEVSQEMLSQVTRSIRTFTYQPELGRFRDWLGAVTRSKLGRFLGKKNRAAHAAGGANSEEALTAAEAPWPTATGTPSSMPGSSKSPWNEFGLLSRKRPGWRLNGPGSTTARPRLLPAS
jgi:hypothetical protein